jgi:hypothetical protein
MVLFPGVLAEDDDSRFAALVAVPLVRPLAELRDGLRRPAGDERWPAARLPPDERLVPDARLLPDERLPPDEELPLEERLPRDERGSPLSEVRARLVRRTGCSSSCPS